MELKAQEVGTCVLLVRADKGFDDDTSLVAEVHSGFEDAKYIAECVNAANDTHLAWPEDVAESLDPSAIQGGVVGKPVEAITANRVATIGRIAEMQAKLDHFTAMAQHHRDCRLSALEKLAQVEVERDELLAAIKTLLDGVDLQAPEGFTPENSDGTLCGRTVNVFDLICCAEIVDRMKKDGAE